MININNKIKKLNNLELSSSAFLAIGLTGVYLTKNVYFLPFVALSLPFCWNWIVNKVAISSKSNDIATLLNGVTGSAYQNLISKEISKYLDESNDLLEKKYKLLFISLWLKKYNLYKPNFKIFSLKIDETLQEIKNQKISKYNMAEFFYNYNDLSELNIIEEDIRLINNKNIKDIANNFAKEGFLAHAFINFNIKKIEALSFFYVELNDFDLKIINNQTIKNNNSVLYSGNNMDEYTKKIISNLIMNQTSDKALNCLEDYFKSFKKAQYRDKDKQYLFDLINKTKFKIELFNKVKKLDNDLPNADKIKIKKNKI